MTIPGLSIITGLFDLGKGALERWQERKTVAQEGKIAIARATTSAKIERMQTKQEGDIAWEVTSIENAGWKDDWFVVILSIPATMCFIPGLAPYVERGFAALEGCPPWYKWAFLVAVASSFGYRKLADLMALKKGA